jgi:hypothetical protein
LGDRAGRGAHRAGAQQRPQHDAHTPLPAFPPKDGLFCESDTDEQLLFNIPFQQKVKVQSITIKGPADGTGPK